MWAQRGTLALVCVASSHRANALAMLELCSQLFGQLEAFGVVRREGSRQETAANEDARRLSERSASGDRASKERDHSALCSLSSCSRKELERARRAHGSERQALVLELLGEALEGGVPQSLLGELFERGVTLGRRCADAARRPTRRPAAQATATAAQWPAVDWRPAGVEHRTQQIFVDVNETLQVCLDGELSPGPLRKSVGVLSMGCLRRGPPRRTRESQSPETRVPRSFLCRQETERKNF